MTLSRAGTRRARESYFVDGTVNLRHGTGRVFRGIVMVESVFMCFIILQFRMKVLILF